MKKEAWLYVAAVLSGDRAAQGMLDAMGAQKRKKESLSGVLEHSLDKNFDSRNMQLAADTSQ